MNLTDLIGVELAQQVIDFYGYDPVDKTTIPAEIQSEIDRATLPDVPIAQLPFALQLKATLETAGNPQHRFNSEDEFFASETRRQRGVAYLRVDHPQQLGFTRKDNLKRAILAQTESQGFVPLAGFTCLVPLTDFDFVKVGVGKRSQEQVWISQETLIRVTCLTVRQVGSVASDRYQKHYEESVGKLKEKCFDIYERQIRGIRALIPEKEDDQWFRDRGLHVPSSDEILQQKARMKVNRGIRNTQRFMRKKQ